MSRHLRTLGWLLFADSIHTSCQQWRSLATCLTEDDSSVCHILLPFCRSQAVLPISLSVYGLQSLHEVAHRLVAALRKARRSFRI